MFKISCYKYGWCGYYSWLSLKVIGSMDTINVELFFKIFYKKSKSTLYYISLTKQLGHKVAHKEVLVEKLIRVHMDTSYEEFSIE